MRTAIKSKQDTGNPVPCLPDGPVSEDELREVAVDHDVGQALVDVVGVDADILVGELRRAEADVLEDFLEQRVQAAGADIFGLLIDVAGELGDAADGIRLEG